MASCEVSIYQCVVENHSSIISYSKEFSQIGVYWRGRKDGAVNSFVSLTLFCSAPQDKGPYARPYKRPKLELLSGNSRNSP